MRAFQCPDISIVRHFSKIYSKMKRRNFLKILPAAGVTSFVVNGHAMRPFANSKIAKIMSACDGVEDRVLVLIQLKGGNDGLNMLLTTERLGIEPRFRRPDAGFRSAIELEDAVPTPSTPPEPAAKK